MFGVSAEDMQNYQRQATDMVAAERKAIHDKLDRILFLMEPRNDIQSDDGTGAGALSDDRNVTGLFAAGIGDGGAV